MKSPGEQAGKTWRDASSRQWASFLREPRGTGFSCLTLVIGALVGIMVVAFILLTEHSEPGFTPLVGRHGAVCLCLWWVRWYGLLALRIFPMPAGAEFRKRKPRCTRAEVEFPSARSLESSSAHPRHSPAESPWAARDQRFKWGRESLLGVGPELGLSPEKVKGADSRRCRSGDRCCLQYTSGRGPVCPEEVVGDLHAPMLGSVVLASATSWAMLRLLLGNDPFFKVPQYQLVIRGEFAIYAVLGVLVDCFGGVHETFARRMRGRFLRFPKRRYGFNRRRRTDGWLMGWFVPQFWVSDTACRRGPERQDGG